MPITAITIENFKGIQEPVRVELKPITLLFGPNSAGKSTIVQALHYAREIFERGNINPDRTLLGGDSIDLGGFENIVNQRDKGKVIRLAFELDLENDDLPVYYDGGIEYMGIDRLDIAGSGYLLDSLARVKTAMIELTVEWSLQFDKPFISNYAVNTNGQKLISIQSSPDALHINISNINPFNPIFFNENIDPEKARNEARRFFEGANNFSEANPGEFWGDLSISNLGDMLIPLFQYLKLEDGIPGLTQPINLIGQSTALPRWGENLTIDSSIFADDIEVEDIPNFTRLLSSLVVGPGELVRNELQKLCYIGPLRKVPERGHKPAFSPGEYRWANGLAAYDILFSCKESFIEKVNKWLTQEERLNSEYSIEVKKYRELEADHPLLVALLQERILDEEMNLREQLLNLPVMRRLLFRDGARNIELMPQDIGVGISQVLPVIVAALHHRTGLVAIEQPELHIHPAFQVVLGDLFIEQVNKFQDLTFLIETHSEHILLRLLRRIRETSEQENLEKQTFTPNDLTIYFFEQGHDGISCLPIRVDTDGDLIDHWPKGFFEERAGELF